jgi:hypothetical protein
VVKQEFFGAHLKMPSLLVAARVGEREEPLGIAHLPTNMTNEFKQIRS